MVSKIEFLEKGTVPKISGQFQHLPKTFLNLNSPNFSKNFIFEELSPFPKIAKQF